MIKFESYDTIEGVTIHADSDPNNFSTFYLLPEKPTFAKDDNGRPLFKFLKYQLPIDRPDGKKGGGYVIFAVELTIPAEKIKKITAELQTRVNADALKREITPSPKVRLAEIPYTAGSTKLLILKNDRLVERVAETGKPSLFGKNVTTFNAELTPEGATIFEQALQGKGGFIAVVYDLSYYAKLPPIKMRVWLDTSAFYTFVQTVNVNDVGPQKWCGQDKEYVEVLAQVMKQSEAAKITIDEGAVALDPKVAEELRGWAKQDLDKATERLLLKELKLENPEDARKWYTEKGIAHVRKEVATTQIKTHELIYEESKAYLVNKFPQGPVPNITEMIDNEGKPIKWSDYAQEIKADDPFFRQINVSAIANASFDALPIHSIELKLSYNGQPMDIIGSPIDGEFRFTSPNEVARFACFKEPGLEKYRYSYQVNYKGSSKVYKSAEMEADSSNSQLTVSVDDAGILVVDVEQGDINFNDIQQVQVSLRYEDKSNNVELIERQFIIDKRNPVHSLKEVIFAPRAQPYQYKCKFFMPSGKTYETDWQSSRSNKLYINDPFQGNKKLRLISIGDLQTQIASIMVDVKYREQANNYEQTLSVVLTEKQPFLDWEFPVIDESKGVVTYSGSIINKDQTMKPIAETTTTEKTILVGEKNADILSVQVMSDLIDFKEVKIVTVLLKYKDEKNNLSYKKEFVFNKSSKTEQLWTIKVADKTKMSYEWSATFFMADNTKHSTGLNTSDELVLILSVPVHA
jgi:hypothetical protein